MKEWMECGKNLRIMEGYRHPTMGNDYLLCSSCFDTVFESVEKYRKFVSPYIGFFNKENRVSYLWSHKTNQNVNETLSIIN
jgi:hypothetical protein